MHLKRLTASKHFPIKRKENKFTTTPRAGPHAKAECIPLKLILRDSLAIAETSTEATKILKSRDVLVDGKSRKDPKYPAGLMDTISIPKMNKHYRIVPEKGKLVIREITEKETKTKLCKITDKTTIKKGITQLNLHDGRNILIKDEKKAGEYKPGDTIEITIPEQEIKSHYKLEKGNIGLIIRGKHEGEQGKIKDIKVVEGLHKNKISITTDKKDIETLKDYIFVIGKESKKTE